MNNERQMFELVPHERSLLSGAVEPDGAGLLEYLRLFMRRKWLILAISLAAAAAGYLISITQPLIYQARITLEVNEPNHSFLNMGDLQPTSSYMTVESFIQTQMRLLQSKSVIQRAKRKVERKAAQPYSGTPPGTDAPSPPESGEAPLKADSQATQTAVSMAAQTVVVRNLPSTRILEVQIDSTDPIVAANYANALIDEFVEHQLETRWESARKTTDWLQTQIQELRKSVQSAESHLQAHSNRTGLLMTSEKGNVAEDKLRQLQQELSAAHSERVNAESRYRIAQSAMTESVPDVLGDSSIRSYALKLTELRGQLIELNATLTPEHYKVKRLQSQIDDLTNTIERERAQIIQRIRNQYEATLLRERMLAASYAQQTAVVASQSVNLAQYSMMKRELDTNRQLYESMLQKVKEAEIASALRATNVRVLSPAEPPSKPYKPTTGKNVLTGLTTGLILSILAIAIRDKLDRHVREPGQMSFSSVPELGVVLSADLKLPGRGRLSTLELAAATGSLGAGLNGNGNKAPVELLTWTHKPSIQAESYRGVLISLLANEQKEKKIFVVTSPKAQEGKTTILCNLAISLAEIDRRVLVIDADLREPRLHTIFDVPNSWGLSDLMQDRNILENRSVESMAKPTGIAGLYVLPSGPGAASIFRLLCSTRIDELLQSAAREFDMVLIDTPPMLGIPDARILARKTDGVILIMRAGYTTRDTAQDAVQRLLDDGIPVVGTVLNDWKPNTNDYGSYYRYVYGSS